MENNNGKGLFYGVIGVATLIVAIIGATFAYFTATTTAGEYLTGQAAVAGLDVAAVRLTTYSTGEVDESGQLVEASAAKYIMVPQLDATLAQAITGTSNGGANQSGACIDANGSLVCSIYKITVRNTGSSAIDVSGEIKFYHGPASGPIENGTEDATAGGAPAYSDTTDSIMNHIKWARLANPADVSGNTIPTALLDYATDESYEDLRPVANAGQTYADTTATQYLYGRSVNSDADDLYGVAYGFTDVTEGQIEGVAAGKYNIIDTDHNGLLSTAELEAVYVTSHGAHYDLLDPTDDMNYDSSSRAWTLDTDAANAKGTIHLEAAGTQLDANSDGVKDDTATIYVVVWISENLASQNEVDKGTFVGQITFNSAAGSGATSTFTEIASSN